MDMGNNTLVKGKIDEIIKNLIEIRYASRTLKKGGGVWYNATIVCIKNCSLMGLTLDYFRLEAHI